MHSVHRHYTGASHAWRLPTPLDVVNRKVLLRDRKNVSIATKGVVTSDDMSKRADLVLVRYVQTSDSFVGYSRTWSHNLESALNMLTSHMTSSKKAGRVAAEEASELAHMLSEIMEWPERDRLVLQQNGIVFLFCVRTSSEPVYVIRTRPDAESKCSEAFFMVIDQSQLSYDEVEAIWSRATEWELRSKELRKYANSHAEASRAAMLEQSTQLPPTPPPPYEDEDEDHHGALAQDVKTVKKLQPHPSLCSACTKGAKTGVPVKEATEHSHNCAERAVIRRMVYGANTPNCKMALLKFFHECGLVHFGYREAAAFEAAALEPGVRSVLLEVDMLAGSMSLIRTRDELHDDYSGASVKRKIEDISKGAETEAPSSAKRPKAEEKEEEEKVLSHRHSLSSILQVYKMATGNFRYATPGDVNSVKYENALSELTGLDKKELGKDYGLANFSSILTELDVKAREVDYVARANSLLRFSVYSAPSTIEERTAFIQKASVAVNELMKEQLKSLQAELREARDSFSRAQETKAKRIAEFQVEMQMMSTFFPELYQRLLTRTTELGNATSISGRTVENDILAKFASLNESNKKRPDPSSAESKLSRMELLVTDLKNSLKDDTERNFILECYLSGSVILDAIYGINYLDSTAKKINSTEKNVIADLRLAVQVLIESLFVFLESSVKLDLVDIDEKVESVKAFCERNSTLGDIDPSLVFSELL